MKIDNNYFPLKPGTTLIYKGTKDGESSSDNFQVTNKVKVIQGISTRVIHDEAFVKGKLSESTDDWFAQDDKEMSGALRNLSNRNATGSHEGSWEAGVKGAKAGIMTRHSQMSVIPIMKNSPKVY